MWALAVGKKTEMLATGGSDAVVNLWYDSTASDKEEAFRKEVNHLCNPSSCSMCVCLWEGERERLPGEGVLGLHLICVIERYYVVFFW